MPEKYHIGIDLDGTLVDYSHIFLRIAAEAGLVPLQTPPDKRLVRDLVRQRHGDAAWQGLQALAYGERIHEARLFDGVLDTLDSWCAAGHALSVVSHKSRYTSLFKDSGPDLHHYARAFLRQSGILDVIPARNVFFCPTRQEKCRQVAELGCHVFVDDLPEVFACALFPRETKSVLFVPVSGENVPPPAHSRKHDAVCRHWREMRATISAVMERHV